MINYHKVSIMIATYNQEKYIGQAIESALNQDYPNFEVVIADDCSTDNTSDVINRYLKNQRLKYFRNEKNLGKAGNYRKLLYDYASGEWVVMLDGDDYFTDNQFISTAMEEMNKHDNVIAIIAGHIISHPDHEYSYIPAENIKLVNGFDLFINFLKVTIGHGSVIYKRELACKIGFYRLNIISDDHESFLRMLLYGNVILLNRIVYVWRHHESNISNTLDINNHIKNLKFIEEPYKHALELGYDNNTMDNWRKRMLSWYFGAYISSNIRLLRRGLISKGQVNKNINELFGYLLKGDRYLLWIDIKILGKIIIYKLFGPWIFETIAYFVKKAKFRNRYSVIPRSKK